ncbi:C10 family peptidase [Muricauda sp. CAU 1633]|uniref:C10 family peptidase n=1 Tax=Allomuricauda sp. CAU 1633 TaxID=2816036 RepID=UPI001A8DB6E9|nr:C10 family peptidase [Muricauda sp. CAU 1633]MBO0321674.1 C10 family peptidase [Muricauda sp. CAU 1633]
MKLLRKRVLTVLSSTIFLVSCNNDLEEPIGEVNQNQDSNYFVSEDEAKSFASIITYTSKDSKYGKTASNSKIVSTSLTVPDFTGKAAYYIINYTEGGFILISADKRTQPILGYSENNTFVLDSEKLPQGLIGWLEETSIDIGNLRRSFTASTGIPTRTLYNPCPMQQLVNPYPNLNSKCFNQGGNECNDSHTYYGPLINSEWNQWDGFNNLLPGMGCNSNGGRPPSGCVATAIGQVMRYYQFPNSYNWGNMPISNQGSNEASELLRDIGSGLNMNYNCNGSSAQTSDGVSLLKNMFGYSSASFGVSDHATIKNEIIAGRPVVLAGYNDKDCFLWWCGYDSGHAWVCEGYKSHFYCDISTQFTYYYMNWGWGGTYNGYYGYNSWNPGNYNFKYNKRMIFDISP